MDTLELVEGVAVELDYSDIIRSDVVARNFKTLHASGKPKVLVLNSTMPL